MIIILQPQLYYIKAIYSIPLLNSKIPTTKTNTFQTPMGLNIPFNSSRSHIQRLFSFFPEVSSSSKITQTTLEVGSWGSWETAETALNRTGKCKEYLFLSHQQKFLALPHSFFGGNKPITDVPHIHIECITKREKKRNYCTRTL